MNFVGLSFLVPVVSDQVADDAFKETYLLVFTEISLGANHFSSYVVWVDYFVGIQVSLRLVPVLVGVAKVAAAIL